MNGVTQMPTTSVPVCAHAYAAAKGFDNTLRSLLEQLAKEQPDKTGLIDLGNGVFISPLDTKVALQHLAAEHTHMATFSEVLDDIRCEDDPEEDEEDFDADEDDDDFEDDDFEDDDFDDDDLDEDDDFEDDDLDEDDDDLDEDDDDEEYDDEE